MLKGSATRVYRASVGTATTRPLRISAAARSSASGAGSRGSISTRSVATWVSVAQPCRKERCQKRKVTFEKVILRKRVHGLPRDVPEDAILDLTRPVRGT